MPIPTDSEAWHAADEPSRFHVELLAFLRENADKAYRPRELADELLDTTFDIGEQRDRLEADLPAEEFQERLRTGELPGGEDHQPLANIISLRYVDIALVHLLDADMVTRRAVSTDAFDLPDEETTNAFTYAGDVDSQRS